MFNRLSEKDKRLYVGAEALKLPYGGISNIAQPFACYRSTILLVWLCCGATRYRYCAQANKPLNGLYLFP